MADKEVQQITSVSTDSGSPTVIDRDGQETLVYVNDSPSAEYGYLQTPADAVEGDELVLFGDINNSVVIQILLQSGESQEYGTVQTIGLRFLNGITRMRKVTPTLWMIG